MLYNISDTNGEGAVRKLVEERPPISERDEELRVALAARLRALRRSYGAMNGITELGQRRFARMLGLTPERYGRYERGEMEPPLGVLCRIRRVTGVSLDVLIAGERHGPPDLISGYQGTDNQLGERLRCVRSIVAPEGKHFAEFLDLMQVDEEVWELWERGAVRPPIEKMEEAAHRMRVTLDFLYRGRTDGLPRDLAVEVKRRYVHEGQIIVDHTGMATHSGKTTLRTDRRIPRSA